MKSKLKYILLSSLILFTTSGCKKSEYHQMVRREMAKDVRYDSLFLGINFGMSRKEFYGHCWKLNKQRLIKQGPMNLTVEYDLELDHRVKMNFYPNFYKDRINEMPIKFQYEAWAPWNRHLFADSLQLELVKWFEHEYGEGFIKTQHPKFGNVYAKVDGNRSVVLWKVDDGIVQALIKDLSVKENSQKTENSY